MTGGADINQERALFSLCLEAPESEWETLLAANCDDPEQRKRVRRLLQRHRDTQAEDAGFLRLDGSDPERIGPYRVLQRLGEGGMGIVYCAEQQEPVRRRVALKVLRHGYNSREVLARFDVERQALALMSHANIARILDAGTTPDRRPFIVMEYVPGEAITHYCEKHALPLRNRLELFIAVCDAVQHAHQRGVIHRDLKPSNILVMEEDGKPVPKVIDFGIAKAVAQRLTEHTLETKVGSLLGTPDYMSPEQAELSPLDLDTRSDVYALGAVLYQLLTGVPPLNLSGSGKGYSEMQRIIREIDPKPASHRASGSLQGKIRGEIDWILAKALEKERNKRYATVTGLADDIKRHLRGEAPVAGPKTLGYLVGKFLRRHYVGTGIIAGAFVLITMFAALLYVQVRETEFERDRANLAAANAREQADAAQRVINFTSGLFELASPIGGGSSDISARVLLDAGVRRLQTETLTDDNVRAGLLEAAGNAYLGLDAYDQAEPLLVDAVTLRSAQAETRPRQLADALISLSRLYADRSELDLAEDAARRAIAAHDNLPARLQLAEVLRLKSRLDEAASLLDPLDRYTGHEQFPDAALALGRIRVDQGHFEQGEALVRQALAHLRKTHGDRSAAVVDAKLMLGETLYFKGATEQAADVFRDALDAAIPIFGEHHHVVGVLLNNLGASLFSSSQTMDDSERAYLRALAVHQAVFGEEHIETANVYNNLGNVYLRQKQWDKAEPVLTKAYALRTKLLGEAHPETLTTKLSLAWATLEGGDRAGAERLARAAVLGLSENLGPRHWRTGNARYFLGLTLLDDNSAPGEAKAQFRQALEILEATLGRNHARTRMVTRRLEKLGDTGTQERAPRDKDR